jgi:hypothetical protein
MQIVVLGASSAPGATPPPLAPVGSPAFPTAPSSK